MIRRTLAAVGLAAVAFAVPAAAQATNEPYPAPDAELICSTTQAAPGSTFTCTVNGADGDEAQLQTTFSGADAPIAGTLTSAVKVIDGAPASFTVTAPSIEGVIGISGIINGEAFDTAEVDVADELSGTGFDNAGLAVAAGAMLVGGAAIVFMAARRRSAQNA